MNLQNSIFRLEETCNAEVLVCHFDASDTYQRVFWQSTSLGFCTSITILSLLNIYGTLSDSWCFSQPLGICTFILLSGAGFGILSYLPWVKRTLLGRSLLIQRSLQKARELTVTNKVFSLKDRNGILIFVSHFERQVVLIAGPHLKNLEPKTLETLAEEMKNDFRISKDWEPVLIKGIQSLQKILLKNGYKRTKSGSPNELSNLPIQRKVGNDDEHQS